jgi:hypothetical protein
MSENDPEYSPSIKPEELKYAYDPLQWQDDASLPPADAVNTVAASLPPPTSRETQARLDALRRTLNIARERWWSSGELPPNALLRDGLLALEAGYELDAGQRALLAHAALASGKGSITALRHLRDPELAAHVVHEAWMAGTLDANSLAYLLTPETDARRWVPLAALELRADLASPLPGVPARAQAGLDSLYRYDPSATDAGDFTLTVEEPTPSHAWVRAALVIALLVTLALMWGWWRSDPIPSDMVAVAAGRYALPLEDGAMVEVALDAFAIDRFEVTNSDYRDCYSAGVCNWPVDGSSATREEYFLDPQTGNHPVVNVTWEQARTFCQWRERRLPTQQEWQVAASYAPATARFYAWPWGPAWEPAFVVGGDSFSDTTAVGSRSPSGDSPLGAADMAGNVAEWTASEVAGAPQMAVVKGGSYADAPAELAPAGFRNVLKSASAPTLGFRCAQ